MEENLLFEGKTYISSKRAGSEYGYTKDYIGQMARSGKIDARLVGRSWYVLEETLQNKRKHKRKIGRSEEMPIVLTESKDPELSAPEQMLDVSNIAPITEQNQDLEQETAPTGQELLKFAYQREPTREELARRNLQSALLANTDIRYKDSFPVFFEDKKPLFVAPVKKKREKVELSEPSELSASNVLIKVSTGDQQKPKNIEKFAPAQQNNIEVVQEDEVITPSGAFWRYAFASIMFIFAVSGTIALSLLEKQSLVTNDGVTNTISTHIDFSKEKPESYTASAGQN